MFFEIITYVIKKTSQNKLERDFLWFLFIFLCSFPSIRNLLYSPTLTNFILKISVNNKILLKVTDSLVKTLQIMIELY